MWGSKAGEAIVAQTIKELKVKHGAQKIYLSGISSGAVGAAQLAHKFAPDIEGAILLFGAHPDIDLTAMPTMLVYGADDERFPASAIEWVARQRELKKGGLTKVRLGAGHFQIVKDPNCITEIVGSWLQDQQGNAHNSESLTQ